MTDSEFLNMDVEAAARHLAALDDAEAGRLLALYVHRNGRSILAKLENIGVDVISASELSHTEKAGGAEREQVSRVAEILNRSGAFADAVFSPATTMTRAGVALIIIGVIVIFSAFSYDVGVDSTSYDSTLGVSIPSRIANIDRISMREMILATGGFAFLAGSFLTAFGVALKAVLSALSLSEQGKE